MEVGLFQLENLALTPARFVFLDLRVKADPAHPHVDRLLTKARRIAAADVESELRALKADTDSPILLVCEDGQTSQAVARRLEAAGFDQIYVVTGGVAGLLSEV